MLRFFPLFPLFLFLSACKETAGPDCETNSTLPKLVWQAPIPGAGDLVLSPFVYDNGILSAAGFNNTQLTHIDGSDGRDSSDYTWNEPRAAGATWLEGDYLYWTSGGNIRRRHLQTGIVTALGSVGIGSGGSGGFNEGLVVPFEGLVAASFHETSMTDRDYVIGVFDMASQQELFRYQVDDAQVTTNLGDPALGRTAAGDTIVAFAESTRSKLLIFNLSKQDSIEVPLPAGEVYFPFSRNIYIRDGRIFLCLRATLYCLDAATGQFVWKRQEGSLTGVGQVRFVQDRLIFNSNNSNLYALDPATGKEIWKNESVGRMGSYTPIWNHVLYYTDQEAGDPVLMGIDLNTGCIRTRFSEFIPGSGGVLGITPNGYLIFSTATTLAAYSL